MNDFVEVKYIAAVIVVIRDKLQATPNFDFAHPRFGYVLRKRYATNSNIEGIGVPA